MRPCSPPPNSFIALQSPHPQAPICLLPKAPGLTTTWLLAEDSASLLLKWRQGFLSHLHSQSLSPCGEFQTSSPAFSVNTLVTLSLDGPPHFLPLPPPPGPSPSFTASPPRHLQRSFNPRRGIQPTPGPTPGPGPLSPSYLSHRSCPEAMPRNDPL